MTLLLVIVIIIFLVGLAALTMFGIFSIADRDFRTGIKFLLPVIVVIGAILFFLYKENRDSWDGEIILMFLIYGYVLMGFLLQGGIFQISKKETVPVIVGILLLLAAAALFVFVYLPIIVEIYETMKLLSGILIILFVVINIKIIIH